jgi:acyl carrier protein
MDKQAAYDLTVEYLAKRFEVAAERIRPESNLFSELGLDSIDALDMLALLDSQWKIKINEEQAKKIRTVQDVVDYICANLPPDCTKAS